MVNKNFRSGTAFEARFLANLIKNEDAVKGGRFYASKGITDVWWVDIKGVHNEAQLKFSSIKKPYISPHELEDLKLFARQMKGFMKIWLIKKQSRKKLEMELVRRPAAVALRIPTTGNPYRPRACRRGRSHAGRWR